MKIRIIAGAHGGRMIDTPPARRTHPMSTRARGALFNSLAQEVRSATVLDAFAGSGALGLEALSRGASSAVLVEKDRVAARIISQSITLLRLGEQAKVVCASVKSWLGTNPDAMFSLIFADPPYHDLQHDSIRALAQRLAAGGVLVLSWPNDEKPLTLPDLAIYRQRSYAGAQIIFYQHK